MDNNEGFNPGENGVNENSAGRDNYSSNGFEETKNNYSTQGASNNEYREPSSEAPNYQNTQSAPNNNATDNYSWNYNEYKNEKQNHPKKQKSTGMVVFCSILAFVLVVGVVGLSGYGIYALYENSKEPEPVAPEADVVSQSENSIELNDKPKDLSGVPVYTNNGLSTVEIAKKVAPSVVGITMYADSRSFDPTGSGSGIIISDDGYIVTNAHVVNGAFALNVELNNGDTYTGKIIGVDTKSDLAVIKVEAEGLPVAEFGNSDELEVGEQIIAIGNPGGSTLFGSVTQGIVSGLNRTIKDNGYVQNFIQVDAAINPGNSGGALVNSFGQVVGINSAKLAAVDYEGIGFSIPIKDAKPIIDDLMTLGYVSGRTKIGISGTVVPETLASIYGYPAGIQIRVIDMDSDLVNTKANMGDIITHIDGVKIYGFDDIPAILEGKKAGDTVKLSLFRPERGGGGKSFEVSCKLMADIDPYAANLKK